MRILVSSMLMGLFATGAAESAEVAPNVVVQDEVVFLTSPDGTLAAHEASTGARRWTSAAASRPLAAQGPRLLAQAPSPDALALDVLEAATGRRVAGTVVDLPDGVSAPLVDTVDTRFLVRARHTPAGVRVSWTWEHRPNRGLLDEEDLDGGLRQARGGVRAELATGRFATASPLADGLVPLPGVLDRDADAGTFRERPLPVGRFWVATQSTANGLALKRWTTAGQPLPDTPLPPQVTLQMGSGDGRHLLLSRDVAGASLEVAHEWTVVALDTGANVAALRTSTAAAAFAVTANRVVVVQQPWERRTGAGLVRQPRRVEAFDRATGSLAWTLDIRDTAYHGPVAP